MYGDFRSEYTLGDYQELDAGFDFYAPQTFEAPDGRRILLGWMGMPDADYTNPTADWSGWQHGMSVPRALHWNGEQTMTTRFYPQGEEQKNRTITLHGEGEVRSDTLQPMTFHWAQA